MANNARGMKRNVVTDEALRLVHQVFLVQAEKRPQVVTFAGVDHGNGCSEICVSVAEILAAGGDRSVCLVDANFRTPALSGLFGTNNHFGLTEALTGSSGIRSYAKPATDADNLWLLSSGSLDANSPGLLASQSLRERLMELRADFEFILIDAPPLGKYGDGLAMGQLSDGMILVIEAASTRRELAAEAVASLRSSNVKILAAVLNKVPSTLQ